MKFPTPFTTKKIASIINAELIGDASKHILGLNELNVAQSGDLIFVDHPKYYKKALQSEASAIIINKKVNAPEDKVLFISENPFEDFNTLIKYFKPFQPSKNPISPSAKISDTAIIQPNCFIGNDVIIGNQCVIHANVTIYDDVQIGDNVIIHSGTVIGGHGFYYQKKNETYQKFESGGGVTIESHVEIGALCSIDKGVTNQTIIKRGSKLDNQVHVGHDTIIGKDCLIAAQVGISGCVVIEDNVTIWGQVGIGARVKIVEGSVIQGQAGVISSIKEKGFYFGTPAILAREKLKQVVAIKQLPNLLKSLKKNDTQKGNK